MKQVSAGRARGITWQQLCARAERLPGVRQASCYGTPALYMQKRFLARLKEDGETVAIRSDLADREVLLEADPQAFYVTDHYRPYPAVLMRLAQVREAVAMELLEKAWRQAAPKRLLLEYSSSGMAESKHSSSPPRQNTTPLPAKRSGKKRGRSTRR